MPVITRIGASWKLGDSLIPCPEDWQSGGDSPQVLGGIGPRMTLRIVKYDELGRRAVLLVPFVSLRRCVVLVVVACEVEAAKSSRTNPNACWTGVTASH